jgi:hypothetical protein
MHALILKIIKMFLFFIFCNKLLIICATQIILIALPFCQKKRHFKCLGPGQAAFCDYNDKAFTPALDKR